MIRSTLVIIIAMGLQLVSLQSQAQFEFQVPEVLETIYEVEESINLEVKDSTFIRNIQGYACFWPAIDVPMWRLNWFVKLQHSMGGGFGVTGLGLAVRLPNNRFCTIGDNPKKVFGIDLVPGTQVQLKLKITRDIVLFTDHNKKKTKVLRERVESKLGTQEIYSHAFVNLESVE